LISTKAETQLGGCPNAIVDQIKSPAVGFMPGFDIRGEIGDGPTGGTGGLIWGNVLKSATGLPVALSYFPRGGSD